MDEMVAVVQRNLSEVRAQVAALERSISARPNCGLGQGDPAVARREMERTLLRRLKLRTESLQRALARIDRGTYGICMRCGRMIHPDRLAVLPDTTTCAACAQTSRHY